MSDYKLFEYIFDGTDKVMFWLDCRGVRGVGIGRNKDSLTDLNLTIFADATFSKIDSDFTPLLKTNYHGVTYSIFVDVQQSK